KPYSTSAIHYTIRRALHEANVLDKVDYIHVSSGGIIPSEFEAEYPFCAYDWNSRQASPAVLEVLREVVKRRLEDFWTYCVKNKTAVFYLREDGNMIKAVRSASLPSSEEGRVRIVDARRNGGGFFNHLKEV